MDHQNIFKTLRRFYYRFFLRRSFCALRSLRGFSSCPILLVVLLCLLGPVWHCDRLGYFAFLWFVTCAQLVVVCLLFLMVSFVGYVLRLWLFLDTFYFIVTIVEPLTKRQPELSCMDENVMRQTACLVFNPIIVDGYASLFNCTTAVRVSDSMTASS